MCVCEISGCQCRGRLGGGGGEEDRGQRISKALGLGGIGAAGKGRKGRKKKKEADDKVWRQGLV